MPAGVGQLPAHPFGLGGPGELPDEPQRAEDARAHPACGGDRAVDDVTLAPHPFHLRVLAAQAGDVRPVRGGPVTIKQASGGQQRRPGADAEDVSSPARVAGDPVAQRRQLLARRAANGRHHDHVRLGHRAGVHVLQRVLRHQGQAAGEHAGRPARGHRVHEECR